MSPLSKATRNHIADVQRKRANDLKKLRDAKRKKNPTFMDKFKKGFKKEEQEQEVDELNKSTMARYTRAAARDINHQGIKGNLNKIKKRVSGIDKATNKLAMRKEDVELDEALNKDWIKAVNDLSKKMGASVAKSSKGGIIPFASRNGKTTNIGYTDSKGKRNVVFSTDKSLSKKEEDKMLSDIRKKFAKEEVEITEAKSKAGDALMAYAKKSGGIDKRDMMTIAGKLQNYAATGNPSNKMDIAKKLKSMDTDPRDKVVEILMANDPAMGRAIMQKAGIKLREETQMDEQKLDELSPMTLRKYRAKASRDQAGGNPMTRDPKRFDKRSKGIARANKKLAGDNPFELYDKPGWEKASKELEAAVKSKNKAKVQQLQKKYAALGARDTEANQAIRQMMGESINEEQMKIRIIPKKGDKESTAAVQYMMKKTGQEVASYGIKGKGNDAYIEIQVPTSKVLQADKAMHGKKFGKYEVRVTGNRDLNKYESVEYNDAEYIEEKYSKSMGFKGVDDMVRRMEKVMTPTSVLCKSISKDADNVVPEFKKMEKAMKIISYQWQEINHTIDMAESVEYDELDEATWYKVDVEGMPTVFMDGSPSSIKAKLRKTLKKGDMINSVDRVTPADMKKWFRDMAKSSDGQEDGAGIDEAFGAKKFSDKQIKMAYGILNDPRWKGGNMTAIVRKIEGIAKGLSSHPGVRAAIRRTNEDTLFDDLIAEELEFLNYVEENFDSMEIEDLEDIIEDTDEDINESDAAYARALEKEREGRLTPNDRDKLSKIRAMLSKEKRAELRRDAKK